MHGIRVIRDDQLPDEFEWALVEERDTGRLLFLVKLRAVGDPQVYADGWAAYRKMERQRECRHACGPSSVTPPPPTSQAWSLQRAWTAI